MKHIIPVAVAATLFAGAAGAQGTMNQPSQTPAPQASTASDMTKTFVMNVEAGTAFEIADSRMAVDHAQNKAVKAFAQRMVRDHTKWAKNLAASIKADKTAMLPGDTQPSADQQQMMNDLKGLSGADFDRAYVDQMVAAHTTDAQAFADYAKGGDDAKIKSFAKSTLPGVQMHLGMITKIQKGTAKTAGL